MPTLRERTRTSSGAIAGTSSSLTEALRGSSNTNAFMIASALLIDQNLDLVGAAGREPLEGARRVAEQDRARDDAFYGKGAGADLGGDAVEVIDPVAPGADDCQVVERPEHRLDPRLADEQSCLG